MLRIHLDVAFGSRPFNLPCGCVLDAPAPQAFGFARMLQWAVGTLSVLLLVLFFVLGHEVEVLIGVVAAAAAAWVTEAFKSWRAGGGK
ncbi:hypothetical protein [Streptomyces sp. CB02009]|uniref:hypothetical protein n=1 Tax=Streptomyces sp. CB02009 TaxID=1703938 RepID=UPI00093EC463|nr:hypothetical protein [Streptomyces sp. CB02009]